MARLSRSNDPAPPLGIPKSHLDVLFRMPTPHVDNLQHLGPESKAKLFDPDQCFTGVDSLSGEVTEGSSMLVVDSGTRPRKVLVAVPLNPAH